MLCSIWAALTGIPKTFRIKLTNSGRSNIFPICGSFVCAHSKQGSLVDRTLSWSDSQFSCVLVIVDRLTRFFFLYVYFIFLSYLGKLFVSVCFVFVLSNFETVKLRSKENRNDWASVCRGYFSVCFSVFIGSVDRRSVLRVLFFFFGFIRNFWLNSVCLVLIFFPNVHCTFF